MSVRATFRCVFIFFLTGIASAVVLWVVAWLFLPDVSGENLKTYTPEEIQAAEKARDVSFDPDNLPVIHVDVDYSEGTKAKWYPKGESPIFARMVREGKLPPVAERVGPEPCVLRAIDGIGKYGGTWLRIASSPTDVSIITWRLSATKAMRWSPLGYPIVPHTIKRLEASEDNRQFTLILRKGMKWSDGHPVTADDILYWWKYEFNDDTLTGSSPIPNWTRAGYLVRPNKKGKVEKLDDFRVKFSLLAPTRLFPELLCGNALPFFECPAHYLKQYHPTIGDKEICEKAMRAYKLPSRTALYTYMKHFQNPEHPRLWPWIYRTFNSTTPQVYVRNPYYCVVDTEGNQLPYVDRLQFDIISDTRMIALAAADGKVTMQNRHIGYHSYTELMSRRKTGDYRVLHWYSADRSDYVINPNLNRLVVQDKPDTKLKAELLADRRFRRALSLAIDRRQIIKAEYNDQTKPSQIAPGETSPFHNERLSNAFMEYDPDRAGRILDEIGLNKRDSEGYRTFPDGSHMLFYLDTAARRRSGITQFIVNDWAKVGMRVIPRERSRRLFYVKKNSREFDFNAWSGAGEHMPISSPRYFVPTYTESFYAVGWARWYMYGGFYDNESAMKYPGVVPVPKDHPMYRAFGSYERAKRATTFARQKQHFDKVLEIAANNTWAIGIATSPPELVIVKNNFRNVPKLAMSSASVRSPGNTGIETYYFERPESSPPIDREIAESLVTPKLRPGGLPEVKTDSGGDGSIISSLIKYLILGIVIAGIALACLHHPYILRRLLIIVPTLLIISVVAFTVIQLPPGDFLTAKVMQLQVSGDTRDMGAIEDLRAMFHFDEPNWKRYCRWMGIYWFATFDDADEGLLQGNMGRSMESTQEVNKMVGDRILLTVMISLGTILFTWAVAIPIGIFSAVRQYSIGDYALTLLGFIGMCVPPFLLALILTTVSGVSGLFSANYAAQPDWDWPKVLDLLKHIWIPVIVLGVGGTAGMIRVMRANLLDELKKPYVVTARAKGVRPIKLLFKYPVRLALNPFISGIGGLFPQLVSGGAIVGMVLALPTVGPLLLDALFNEDMYLAGSMLMVLSLLGVLGTLVSDLLLLWLDPRIRFKSGGR